METCQKNSASFRSALACQQTTPLVQTESNRQYSFAAGQIDNSLTFSRYQSKVSRPVHFCAKAMSESVHGEPFDGMCCLCTMEDITLEDGNYGTHESDRGPSMRGIWSVILLLYCLSPWDDVPLTHSRNLLLSPTVEYQSYPSLKWKPCLYERMIVEKLQAEQFHDFVERVKKTDCQAELRRLLSKGPPVYLHDEHALPLEEGDTHVSLLWFASDGQERSAKLHGAVEGEERDKLWAELNEFLIEEGKEEGDDDEGETAGKDGDKA